MKTNNDIPFIDELLLEISNIFYEDSAKHIEPFIKVLMSNVIEWVRKPDINWLTFIKDEHSDEKLIKIFNKIKENGLCEKINEQEKFIKILNNRIIQLYNSVQIKCIYDSIIEYY